MPEYYPVKLQGDTAMTLECIGPHGTDHSPLAQIGVLTLSPAFLHQSWEEGMTKAKGRGTARRFGSPAAALGSFYFIHKSLKNIHQFDFNAQEFRKVSGKEICAVTPNGSSMVEKEKFPQDYFPEGKWSRKGFIRTRWALGDCAFDLVNIHLFHDADNVVAWEESPSLYTGIRQKALEFVLHRITDQRYEKLPYFLFGDFNFRLDFRSLIERGRDACRQIVSGTMVLESVGLFKVWALSVSTRAPIQRRGKRRESSLNGGLKCSNHLGSTSLCVAQKRKPFVVCHLPYRG
ncbi:hypothetical protein GOODEAATRI_004629 [Goodea atripinnis]|uniref:inositol-polyphosphate 5-phosphatase n=1 Tax=Goodea atripinnis TaxID=208336 RepID=A0ABV0PL13_9TELE